MTPINWWALPDPLPPQKKKLLSFSPSPHKKKTWSLLHPQQPGPCAAWVRIMKKVSASVFRAFADRKTPPTPPFDVDKEPPGLEVEPSKSVVKKPGRKPEKGKGIVIFQLSLFQGCLLLVFKGVKQMEMRSRSFEVGFSCVFVVGFEILKGCYVASLIWDDDNMMWYDDMIWNDMMIWYATIKHVGKLPEDNKYRQYRYQLKHWGLVQWLSLSNQGLEELC